MSSSNDWLPAQTPFEVVRRGYHPEQVTAHMERLEYELRIATANRDASNERMTELTTQLQAVQAEADTLRAQLDRNALEPVSMAGMSDRMQRMIRLAEEEASEIRARAEDDAAGMRSDLQAALDDAKEKRAAFDLERERTRAQLSDQVSLLIGEATAEATTVRSGAADDAARLVADATAEANRLITEATERADRQLAEATATATGLVDRATSEANRLTSGADAMATRLTVESTALATKLVADARQTAESTTSAATAAAQRLESESAAHRTEVEEDFEITIQARRTEAYRLLTEREANSVAEADRRVTEATAEATRTVTEAQAEATRLVDEANAAAAATVAAAAAEASHRVAEADRAVQELTELREQVRGQLVTLGEHLGRIRGMVGATAPVVAELPDEPGRQRAEDFPVDPAQRPVTVPAQ